MDQQICSADSCQRPVKSRGFCGRHYQQIRRHGRLTPEREYLCDLPTNECTVSGCSNTWVAKGHCYRHYQQIRRHGRLMPDRRQRSL